MRGKIAALIAVFVAAAGAACAAAWARARQASHELEPELEVREPRSSPVAPVRAAPEAAAPAASAPAASAPVASAPVESAPVESAPAARVPVAPTSAVTAARDDLTAIKGLGKVKSGKLVAAGVTSFAQIAAWTDADIPRFGLITDTSPGQIKREDWVGQAQALAEG